MKIGKGNQGRAEEEKWRKHEEKKEKNKKVVNSLCNIIMQANKM